MGVLMVWGTHAAARREQLPACGTIDIPPPRMIQCANCESHFVLLPGQDRPPHWKLLEGEPLCPDCAPPPKGELRAATGRGPKVEPASTRPIGASAQRRKYHGCRIGHEVALGFAAIQVRAGASPPDGRDEAVQFMLDAHEIDELIIHLHVIRSELVASQTPGTSTREGLQA
jgi:hypothetical protein